VPFHKLVIEIDGPTHKTDGQKTLDAERDSTFVKAGFRILRVKNSATKDKDNVETVKKICTALLKTRHALKAYSLLKQIKQKEWERKKVERKIKCELDEAFAVSIQRIFEEKNKKRKSQFVQLKVKGKGKGRKVACPGCGFKLYPNERQCPMCQTIRMVGDRSKAKPIKSGIDSTPRVKLRKRTLMHPIINKRLLLSPQDERKQGRQG
jgi:rubredoxin